MPPREQQAGYVPPGPAPLLMGEWGGIDTSTTRVGLPDDKLYWSNGFFPFGPGALRTLPDVGPSLYDWGSPLIYKLFASNTSVYSFGSNGHIVQTNLSAGNVSTTITTTFPGTAQQTVGACQIQPGIIAIVTDQVADGLFIWDEGAATFYSPGMAVPSLGGAVIPTGIAGTTCEMYSGRLWIGDATTLLASSPASVLDFVVANGAVSDLDTDSFLRNRYVRFISAGGFLYLLADSSVNYISGVTVETIAGVPTTTFTNQNADPEIGARLYPDGVVAIGRNIGVLNPSGYYLSYGATFTKISMPLDGVFTINGDISASALISAARVDIFGRRCLAINMPIIDPTTNGAVNIIFLWDGKRWFPSTQSVDIRIIVTWESFGHCFAIGTDLQKIYYCFDVQSSTLNKFVQSKLWATPEGYHTVKTVGRVWVLANYNPGSTPAAIVVDVENETVNTASPQTATYTITAPAGAGYFLSPPRAVGQMGVLNGMTIRTHSADMTLISAMLQPELASYRG